MEVKVKSLKDLGVLLKKMERSEFSIEELLLDDYTGVFLTDMKNLEKFCKHFKSIPIVVEMLVERDTRDIGEIQAKWLYADYLRGKYIKEYEEAKSKKFGLIRYHLSKLLLFIL